MNRILYLSLWAIEVLVVVALILALILPIQDYALKEYIEWSKHPSPDTYQAFLQKQRQERGIRFLIAIPFVVIGVSLTGLLRKYRKKST